MPPPLMSSATPPSTPTRLTSLSFSPLQLGTQDSLSTGGDTMGGSTSTLPSRSPGNVTCPPQSSWLPGLDQSSEAGVPPPLTLRLWTD